MSPELLIIDSNHLISTPCLPGVLVVSLDRMGDVAEDKSSFYSNAEDYWKEVPPTVDGMLGGYGSISSIDISGSKAFLRKFLGVRDVSVSSVWSAVAASCPTCGVPHRTAKGRRGRAAPWTAARESAASASGCCCRCSGPWTWWT